MWNFDCSFSVLSSHHRHYNFCFCNYFYYVFGWWRKQYDFINRTKMAKLPSHIIYIRYMLTNPKCTPFLVGRFLKQVVFEDMHLHLILNSYPLVSQFVNPFCISYFSREAIMVTLRVMSMLYLQLSSDVCKPALIRDVSQVFMKKRSKQYNLSSSPLSTSQQGIPFQNQYDSGLHNTRIILA